MDWFQPFDSSLYSVGVIYAVICNLPRTERYKSHNILTLAVIPGPKEPKLHEINNYLYPIINQLVHLWSGYNIVTHENKSGHFIRGAIILPSRIKKPMSKYYVMAKNNYVDINVY